MAAAAVSTMDLERLVGIAEYVSPDAPGVGGIIKARPADFQVNELTTADCEVILEECEPPGAARIIAAVAVPAVQSAAADDDSEELMITRFTLRKERMDTLGAIAELARQLEVPSRSFGFAGLKDHRAVTTQELTVRGVPPAAVRTAEHSHFQVCVKSCRLVPRALRLGQHGGNRFRIVLRGVDGTAADIEAALGALRRRGFVNYYGLQRFGESAARNDEVGKHLLLGEYALAVDALLRPRPEDKPRGAEAEARDVWVRSNDCRTALKLMPRARFVEREILGSLCHSLCRGHLLSHEERCRLAMLCLPLNMRRLLAHAYFSKVWNLVASERLRRHGLQRALEGEIVLPKRMLVPKGEKRMRGGAGMRREAAHVVTAEEAAAGVYSARRVVLPLPGSGIQLPQTAVGGFYAQLLELDGLDPQAPCLERSAKRARVANGEGDVEEAAVGGEEEAGGGAAAVAGEDEAAEEEGWNWLELEGDYRPLLLRPRQMTWEVAPAVPLRDVSEHRRTLAEAIRTGTGGGAFDVSLRFDLPPGAYATIALREVQKSNPPPSRQSHIRFC